VITSNGYVLDETPARLGRLEPVPGQDRDDLDALWRRMRRDGHLYLTGFLDRDDVLAFRRFYFDAMRGTGLVDPDGDAGAGFATDNEVDRAALRRALYDVIVPSPEYDRLVRSPRIVEWFSWFLGEEVRLHRRRILRHTRPGENGIGTATQAHYDLVYRREGTDRVLSMWIPLGDCPIERGGLTYLERSHHRILELERRGDLPKPIASITADLPGLADEHDERWLVADYRAGDVVVHSAHLVHASLDNVDRDGIMRLSTDIRYQRVTEPIDWRWDFEESHATELNFFQFLSDPTERERMKDVIEGMVRRGGRVDDETSWDELVAAIADPAERDRVREVMRGDRTYFDPDRYA
jgi:hypothetical protein